ncbi:MAG: hypothetical protein R3B90_07920 [Planctomycetaceae bacterium]
MNQMTRTLVFVIAASLAVIGAIFAHIMTRPPTVAGYSDVGELFYPTFIEPAKATAIRVAAWNSLTNQVERFEVRNNDGQWVIPSHQNYPADGERQLARAAASAMGVQRRAGRQRTEVVARQVRRRRSTRRSRLAGAGTDRHPHHHL